MKLHPSWFKKKFIHVDMDMFFAACEIRENPSLADLPVIVGGSVTGRGVVSTCNYIARTYGIRSAMSSARAKVLCPHAVFVKSNFELYKQVSEQVMTIFRSITPLVEPLSMDEAYLDVTEVAKEQSTTAVKIAAEIRQQIFEKTRLTASAGVAPNKMIAKIASDLNKPNGLSVILPHQIPEFLEALSIRKIPGVGPATEKKLSRVGVFKCSDVKKKESLLLERFGKFGPWILERAQGIDEREISKGRVRKSIGLERTFPKDLQSPEEVEAIIKQLAPKLEERLKKKNAKAGGLTLKIKFSDFEQITRAQKQGELLSSAQAIEQVALSIYRTVPWTKAIRLVGLTGTKLDINSP